MAKLKSIGGLQMPLFEPPSIWTPPDWNDLPSWADADRIGIDTETCDPYLKTLGPSVRRGGFIAGISFAIEDGPKFYLPIAHEGGDNMDRDKVIRYLRQNAAMFKGTLVGANISYDLDYLAEIGILFPNVKKIRDVQIAAPLINELEFSFSLNNILKRLNLPTKNEQLLREAAEDFGVDPKGGMWRLPARYVGEYAEDDAELPLQALRKQETLIDKMDLWDVYDLESDVLPVLLKMRRRGVLIDQDKLSQVEDFSKKEETQALNLVKRETGVDIGLGNIWKADALAPALQAIGMTVGKTDSGKWSVDQELLGSWEHKVPAAIAWARKVNKLRTTFAQSIRDHMVDGRIHCIFNQIARETEAGGQKGGRYGRLSAMQPNMQQQPSRDQFASMWRSIYLPDKGQIWSCNDFSQQEPRWTTHFAAVLNLTGAREAAQAYHDDPNLDNHQFMSDLTGVDRKYAKAIYLGLCYGEGGGKLAEDLGLSTRWAVRYGSWGTPIEYFDDWSDAVELNNEKNGFMWKVAGAEAQDIIDRFNDRAPYVKELADYAKKRAEKKGKVRTIGGRVLNFELLDSGKYDECRRALNRLIQGSAADQTKRAMVEVDKAGHDIMLQVHDELDCGVDDKAEAEEISRIMETSTTGLVPFRVDTELGPNWGEIK